jgi:hypothetical protein
MLYLQLSRYAYTNELKLSSMKEALAILQWSKEYKADKLKSLSEHFISSKVDQDTVWDILGADLKATQALTWAKSVGKINFAKHLSKTK